MSRASISFLVALIAFSCGGGNAAPPDAARGDAPNAADSSTSTDSRASNDLGPQRDVAPFVAGPDLLDRDGDGVVDSLDAFPEDSRESRDEDRDGIGNVADTDEDGDGVPDLTDELPLGAGSTVREIASTDPADTRSTVVPVRFTGRIESADDEDRFVFPGTVGTAYTAVVVSAQNEARPMVHFVSTDGPMLGSQPVSSVPAFADAAASVGTTGDQTLRVRAKSGAPFDYVLHVFVDRDLDLAPDEREIAFGGSDTSPDSDRDGVFDGDEVWSTRFAAGSLDVDMDGRAAIVDDDSDADGLADRIEGSADLDGDGVRNLLDLDADGDGDNDATELDMGQPSDRDGDETPDALDLDEDADLLPDSEDADPDVALPFFEPTAAGALMIQKVATKLPAGEIVYDVSHGMGTLLLQVAGLTGVASDYRVLFATPAGPIARRPTSIDVVLGTVELPVVTTATAVALERGSRRTVALAVRGLSRLAPILTGFEDDSVIAGRPLIAKGYNLGSSYAAYIDNMTQASELVSDTRRSVAFPMRDGVMTVGALVPGEGFVQSNGVRYRVESFGTYNIMLPAGATITASQLTVVGLPDIDPAGDGTTPIAYSRPTTVTAQLPGATPTARPSTVLSRIATGTAGSYRLDATSTAVAMVVLAGAPTETMAIRELPTLLRNTEALPEVRALATAIGAALVANPRALDTLTGEVKTAFVAAHSAFQRNVLGTITTVSPVVSEGVITPPELDDISVHEIPRGNLKIENDTMLYLSVRVVDAKTEQVLVPHVTGYLDPAMIGTQNGIVTLLLAGESDLDQPRYRDARIEVITPGMIDNGGPAFDEAEGNAYFYVSLRSFIDKAVVQALGYALGKAVSGEDFANLIFQQLPDLVANARALYLARDPKSAWSLIVSALKNDLDEIGPFTLRLARLLGGPNIALSVAESIARTVGAKMVPVLGQLEALLDAVTGAATAINMGKYAVDVYTTGSYLEFRADWTVGIEKVLPSRLANRDGDTTVILHGIGFGAARNPSGPGHIPPRIIFGNRVAGNFETTPIAEHSNDRIMFVKLPGEYIERAREEISVMVRNHGDDARAQPGIAISVDRLIDRLDPPYGQPGDTITLVGGTFSGNPSMVRVFFESTENQTDPARMVFGARVLHSTEHSIRVEIPREIGVIPEARRGDWPRRWYVSAFIGPAGFESLTNTRPFTTATPGSWVMTSTFGTPTQYRYELWTFGTDSNRPPVNLGYDYPGYVFLSDSGTPERLHRIVHTERVPAAEVHEYRYDCIFDMIAGRASGTGRVLRAPEYDTVVEGYRID